MIVIDASVAVKWFVREAGHGDAIDVVESGQTLSQLLDHSVYDCCYLACAISSGSILLTADGVFYGKAVDKGYGEVVRPLSDWPTAANQRSEVDGRVIASVMALYDQVQKTLDAVSDLVSEPFGPAGTRVVNSGDLKPAFASPSYVKLARIIAGLGRSDRAKLLALGWYGQSGEGGDWSLTLSRAEAYLSDDPADHLAYTISKIGLFGDGLRRLRMKSSDTPVED